MALKSTVSKARLEVVDLDRNYFANHELTLAQHPSETDLRLMVRLLAFALHAHERLAFGKGVSDSEEPDLWLKDLDGQVDLWVELGHPDDRTLTKACGRARKVVVYTYSASPRLWWDPLEARAARWRNLQVVSLDAEDCEGLAAFAGRSLDVQVTIQDGDVWVRADGVDEVRLTPVNLKE